MKKDKIKIGIIPLVAVLFAISILVTGVSVYFSQRFSTDDSVRKQMEKLAAEVADETEMAIKEYPAYEWLIKYWYEHSGELDIEYDMYFGERNITKRKLTEFTERNPQILMKYTNVDELEALPVYDQKLYAEITYSWLITHLNEIKRSYHVDFLFCVITGEACTSQFFLISAADKGSVRGTDYEQVYPLGVTVNVSGSQSEAMKKARKNSSHLAAAGKYVDYYSLLCEIDNFTVLTGVTFNVSTMRNDVTSGTVHGLVFALIHQILLSAICLGLIYFFVLRPLKNVQHSIREYKNTKNSEDVKKPLEKTVLLHNELGQLSRDIVSMTEEIDEHVKSIETITSEKERIVAELGLASRIQMAMLPGKFPAFPERTDFDVFASMDPAKEVGGDFYDFFLIDDDHLCLTIADVSGKGIPAALFMMASKIILANNAMLGKSPAEILSNTNAAICSNNSAEMFVTVWLGILELSTGKLTAANAGHEYPVIRRAGGNFELIKDKHGFVIGGIAGSKYKEYELMLGRGDTLFLYTDGLPEATDNAGNMFGNSRMLDALNEAEDNAPEAVIQHMRGAVNDFVASAEQFDDLTMMCVKVG